MLRGLERGIWVLAVCLLAGVVVPGQARGQAAEGAAGDPEKLTTLHVYADLIQVPVLVLDSFREPTKRVQPDRFRVSLDSGPEFKPRTARREGEDPLALAVLTDMQGEGAQLGEKMPGALAGLVPGGLHEQDRVWMYALDCSVMGMKDRPAEATALEGGMENVLQNWHDRVKLRHAKCGQRAMGLWDAMAIAVQALGAEPSRRVLLVVSDGQDRGSRTKWMDLIGFAQARGVAIFGAVPGGSDTAVPFGARLGIQEMGQPFQSVCESTGGMVMRVRPGSLDRQLERLMEAVRDRYILEFVRARKETPGLHTIVVKVAGQNLVVRVAGVTVPLPDPAVMSSPGTIQRDTTDAPEYGKRKVLTPPPH